MGDTSPILMWFRRDLRLSDNPALHAAAETGRPVIPVFLNDECVAKLGAAPKWRLGLGVDALAHALRERGSRLVLRRGPAYDALRALAAQTGARSVWWGRLHDPDSKRRDTGVKAALRADGLDARSFGGHLLFEPWQVQTGQGRFYQVYSPYWRAVRDREVPEPLPAPSRLPVPETWPDSDRLCDWALGRAMNRGAEVVAQHVTVGEAAAQARLGAFVAQRIEHYQARRDFPALQATSGLSENLSLGEISPRRVWHAGQRALAEGKAGAETFLKEIVWREFAWHLIHHTPHITERNWRDGWDSFAWRTTPDDGFLRWQQGRTGIVMIDAAMRELYVTGTMHNRCRMLVASYLTKHMLMHWKLGMDWFADCLIDWDPASNAMGWQWAAGSGPDAAPYFRIFNPDTQAEKFDRAGDYRRRWLAEFSPDPPSDARDFYRAIPRSWALSPDMPAPEPLVGLAQGRARALAAYERKAS